MFGFLRHGRTRAEERTDIKEYLREVRPLVQVLSQEYQAWLSNATTDGRTLSLTCDPTGEHAAVYLWRVGPGQPPPCEDPARQFVQRTPVKAAKRYHEHLALCLEARAAAAEAFKEAADRVGVQDPKPRIAEANRKLAESEREMARANAALQELEVHLARS
jgi:hypothetical protein